MTSDRIALFWFRRDLRLEDNHGSYRALTSGLPVLPVFIFDTVILDKLEDRNDRRVSFLHDQVLRLSDELRTLGTTLIVEHGEPVEVFTRLLDRWPVAAVYTNHDHEPYARKRDVQVKELLQGRGIAFHTFKDQTVFERDEVVKGDGTPYTVYTPYMRKWRAQLSAHGLEQFPSEAHVDAFLRTRGTAVPDLRELGFERASYSVARTIPSHELLSAYAYQRDRPAVDGTTGIGVHLRFGTVSVRRMVQLAMQHSETWLNELIWREFFMQILWHFPHVAERAFRPAYDRVEWRNDETDFRKWCEGRTGFPLVDAGMRQLKATGFMHNRVRMVVASFLTKHLLIDWRWGETWFARWLLDFELASNNGNWQWAAGTGCDAAPYFRVFNPQAQQERFDPKMEYVLRWAPEYGTSDAPPPMVEHSRARDRAVAAYRKALSGSPRATAAPSLFEAS